MAKPLRKIVPLDEQGTLAGGGRDRTEVATRPNKPGTIVKSGRPAGDWVQQPPKLGTLAGPASSKVDISQPPDTPSRKVALGPSDIPKYPQQGSEDTGGPGQTVKKKQPEAIALK